MTCFYYVDFKKFYDYNGLMENKYVIGDEDFRPWGHWRTIDCGDGFVVKRITVNSGAILSLQNHKHRNEHWTIVQGLGYVTLGKDVTPLNIGECISIPALMWHRIENRGDVPLVFIEVQTGDILDENDIVRIEDKYGRSSPCVN